MVKLSRFDVCLVNLDPTLGAEIKKTRPVVIISPNTMNHSRLKTIIVAPMTSTIRPDFPTRISICFKDREGQVALDQIRAIDRVRVIKRIGELSQASRKEVLDLLAVLFQP